MVIQYVETPSGSLSSNAVETGCPGLPGPEPAGLDGRWSRLPAHLVARVCLYLPPNELACSARLLCKEVLQLLTEILQPLMDQHHHEAYLPLPEPQQLPPPHQHHTAGDQGVPDPAEAHSLRPPWRPLVDLLQEVPAHALGWACRHAPLQDQLSLPQRRRLLSRAVAACHPSGAATGPQQYVPEQQQEQQSPPPPPPPPPPQQQQQKQQQEEQQEHKHDQLLAALLPVLRQLWPRPPVLPAAPDPYRRTASSSGSGSLGTAAAAAATAAPDDEELHPHNAMGSTHVHVHGHAPAACSSSISSSGACSRTAEPQGMTQDPALLCARVGNRAALLWLLSHGWPADVDALRCAAAAYGDLATLQWLCGTHSYELARAGVHKEGTPPRLHLPTTHGLHPNPYRWGTAPARGGTGGGTGGACPPHPSFQEAPLHASVLEAAVSSTRGEPDGSAKACWLLRAGCSVTQHAARAAAQHGCLPALQLLVGRLLLQPSHVSFCQLLHCALAGGHVAAADWLVRQPRCLPQLHSRLGFAHVLQGVARGGHRRAFRWLLLHLPRLPPAAASLSALSGPGSALLGPGAAGVAVLPDRCALTMARCLKEAVLGGHAWLLPWLINNGASSSLLSHPSSLMASAAKSGSKETVRMLVSYGCRDCRTALWTAAAEADVAMMSYAMTELGCGWDDKDPGLSAALAGARGAGALRALRAMQWLVSQGCGLCRDESVVAAACATGDVVRVRWLVEEQGMPVGPGAVVEAARGGCVAVLQLVLRRCGWQGGQGGRDGAREGVGEGAEGGGQAGLWAQVGVAAVEAAEANGDERMAAALRAAGLGREPGAAVPPAPRLLRSPALTRHVSGGTPPAPSGPTAPVATGAAATAAAATRRALGYSFPGASARRCTEGSECGAWQQQQQQQQERWTMPRRAPVSAASRRQLARAASAHGSSSSSSSGRLQDAKWWPTVPAAPLYVECRQQEHGKQACRQQLRPTRQREEGEAACMQRGWRAGGVALEVEVEVEGGEEGRVEVGAGGPSCGGFLTPLLRALGRKDRPGRARA